MITLEDAQIWECETCVIQVQSMGKSYIDFRGIIFSKSNDGSLRFVSMIYNEKNRLVNFILGLKMTISKKHIMTKERDINVKR